jgi:uncharacterized coiled-coil protein SlyX
METAGEFSRRLKGLKCQLRRQTAVVEELGGVLDECAKNVLRRDQAVHLRALLTKVMREVDDAQMTEVVASNEFNTRKLRRGALSFAAGALFAAIAGQRDPLSRGANLVQPVLDQKAPFGTVLVAVRKDGLPDDVKVVSLSRLARDSNRSESEITDILRERGYLLMAPKIFAALVDKLESRVLDGSVSLPVSIGNIASELPGIMRSLTSKA